MLGYRATDARHPTPEPEVASLVSRAIDDSGIGTHAGRLRVSYTTS